MAGAGLHVQAAEPGAPVQDWFVGQAVGAPFSKKQLFTSCEQVARLPPRSQNLPAVLHTATLHSQRPLPVLHDWREPQAAVVCVKKQLSVSFAQWTDELPTQTSPAAEQFVSTTQPQAPTPEAPVQVWCVPQATAASANRQLFASFRQVETVELVAQNVELTPLPQSVGGASHEQAPVGLLPLQLS